MPYVNIDHPRGRKRGAKGRAHPRRHRALRDTLGKNPATTVVVIDEVDTDNWGIGGESVTVRRKSGR
jgi:4-oxalocrotonate tautomerase